MFTEKVLRPDSKGRICLGRLAEGVSSFHLTVDEERRIVLVPYSEIPSREKWLFDNPEALASVKRGSQDSKAGRISSRGSFSQFADESDD
ncbi:MAG: hypothetical protein KAJ78_07015 [Acidobacteria bacterium]|nr:hypothetical protein [Acidobacteriota bacterium]